VDEIFQHAVKLLRRRDYTVEQMRQKLRDKFEIDPETVIQWLLQKKFLDDRRVAENIVNKSKHAHPKRVLQELLNAGIAPEIADAAVQVRPSPSLRDVVKDKIKALRLCPPLERREAARLFRTLNRLGYEEEEIREELEQLHEQ
jgi:SOS response regulatory protein OraA/RecX